MIKKKCGLCKEEKPLEDFSKGTTLFGRKYACKQCSNEQYKKYKAHLKSLRPVQIIHDLPEEVWVEVKNYPTYLISSLSRIKSLAKRGFNDRLLKPGIGKNGYYVVSLTEAGTPKTFYLHRLLAEHFIPPIEGKTFVNHADTNKLNNAISNLEWCTNLENLEHAAKNGRFSKGAACRGAVLMEADALYIKKSTETLKELVTKFGVSESTISHIRTGKGWKHLNNLVV